MKLIVHILILSCITLLASCTPPPSSKVMTLNIRYNNPNDGDNWWELRKGEVVALIKNNGPDFLGLQEALPDQTAFIAKELDTYKYVGQERDGVGSNSEAAPFFYNFSKYELLQTQTIWLSETPDTISVGWDASMNRIVTYGVFKDKSTIETIHVFNAHYDHIGAVARQKSSELIVNYVQQNNLSNENIVVMGDFNSLPTDTPIETLKTTFEDSFDTKGVPVDGTVGTFNAFDTTAIATKRIDYIFTKNTEVLSYRCIEDRRTNGLHVSDHFGLVVQMR